MLPHDAMPGARRRKSCSGSRRQYSCRNGTVGDARQKIFPAGQTEYTQLKLCLNPSTRKCKSKQHKTKNTETLDDFLNCDHRTLRCLIVFPPKPYQKIHKKTCFSNFLFFSFLPVRQRK
jgi:hypothetical protein